MNSNKYEVIYVIVEKNKGSKILKESRSLGAGGGTIVKANGTFKNKLLNYLTFYSTEKEMVILCINKSLSNKIYEGISSKFELNKKGKGIMYSIELEMIIDKNGIFKDERENKEAMYKLINVIVEKGNAQDVIEFANEAGARGGTVVNARGSGTEQTMKFFNMEIEPEKEIIMIISKNNDYEKIVNKLSEKLELDKPGKGILFVQDISNAIGMYEE